jgi:hypothetical protein
MNLNYEMLYCFLIILSGTFEAESPAPKGNLGKSVLDEKIYLKKNLSISSHYQKKLLYYKI